MGTVTTQIRIGERGYRMYSRSVSLTLIFKILDRT